MAVTLKGPITIDQVAQFVRDISLIYLKDVHWGERTRVEMDTTSRDIRFTYNETPEFGYTDYRCVFAYGSTSNAFFTSDRLRFMTIIGDISDVLDASKGLRVFPSVNKTFILVTSGAEKENYDRFIAFRDAKIAEAQMNINDTITISRMPAIKL